MDADGRTGGYELLHPIYLDVPMMVSFLAHLDGGVATREEETTTASGAKERVLKARAGARARFLPFLDGEVSGKARHRSEKKSRVSRNLSAIIRLRACSTCCMSTCWKMLSSLI